MESALSFITSLNSSYWIYGAWTWFKEALDRKTPSNIYCTSAADDVCGMLHRTNTFTALSVRSSNDDRVKVFSQNISSQRWGTDKMFISDLDSMKATSKIELLSNQSDATHSPSWSDENGSDVPDLRHSKERPRYRCLYRRQVKAENIRQRCLSQPGWTAHPFIPNYILTRLTITIEQITQWDDGPTVLCAASNCSPDGVDCPS